MMTSQEQTDEKQELVEKAKSLGVKNAHACSVETLKEKIGMTEEKVETPARKRAPRMRVLGARQGGRDAIIADLEAQNPGYKYVLENANVTAEQLKSRDLESTGKYLKNDLICRMDIDYYNEFLEDRNVQNEKVMHSIYDEGDTPSFDAQAKKPKG
jgi:hypothetical protein